MSMISDSSEDDADFLLETNSFFAWDICFSSDKRFIHRKHKELHAELIKDPELFYSYTRMSIKTFEYILKYVEKDIRTLQTNFLKNVMSPADKLILTLRFLSTGISHRKLAQSHSIGKSSVSRVVYQTCDAIWSKLRDVHMPKPTTKLVIQSSQRFLNKWQFPNCVGALGDKVCNVVKYEQPEDSRMKSHYLVLQALVDADERFTLINVGVKKTLLGDFNYLNVKRLLKGLGKLPKQRLPGSELDMPLVVLGDKAYPLKDYLMRPYSSKKADEVQKQFNKRLTNARICVEKTFGILCHNWRFLNKCNETSGEHSRLIIKTCCLLHNIVIDVDRDSLDTQGIYKMSRKDGSTGRRNNTSSRRARQVRDNIAQYIYNNPI